jgi:hypothetical protein
MGDYVGKRVHFLDLLFEFPDMLQQYLLALQVAEKIKECLLVCKSHIVSQNRIVEQSYRHKLNARPFHRSNNGNLIRQKSEAPDSDKRLRRQLSGIVGTWQQKSLKIKRG